MRASATTATAAAQSIFVNAIQCGSNSDTEQFWREIALLGKGDYVRVENHGQTTVIASPYDSELAKLSRELEETSLYYGSEQDREEQRSKTIRTESIAASASPSAMARRAEYLASDASGKTLSASKDLVLEYQQKTVSIGEIDRTELPRELQSKTNRELEELVQEKLAKRKDIQQQIAELSKKRSAFIAQKRTGSSEGNTFDSAVVAAMNRQSRGFFIAN